MPDSWTTPDPALVKLVADLPRGSALDVGCGGGHDALWLAKQGWQVTALDSSRHAVSKVRKLAAESGLSLVATRADITTLDEPLTFDLISICYMHLADEDRRKMLNASSQALAPGGKLLFRSFEASVEEAPFDRALLPSRANVVDELSPSLEIDSATVEDEYFPYLKREMTLLTVVATRKG